MVWKKKLLKKLRFRRNTTKRACAAALPPLHATATSNSDDNTYLITRSCSSMADTEDAVAAADKQMEERAARAKALLAQRYQGLRTDQVRYLRGCSLAKSNAFIYHFTLVFYRKNGTNVK